MYDLCFACFKEKNTLVCPHCGFDLMSYEKKRKSNILPAGATLNNRYLIGSLLKEGDFYITYTGYDLFLGKKLVIKEYYPSDISIRRIIDSEDIRSYTVKLAQETMRNRYIIGLQDMEKVIQIMSSINLPGIVNVHDFFETNGTAYMTMDYVEGQDLRTYVNNKGNLSDAMTFSLMRPIIAALAQAHEYGIFFGNINPENIMIDADGKATLIGLASVIEAYDDKNMKLKPKHGYAPLEQYDFVSKQGPWTDVYSLCATMLYMLIGKEPCSAVSFGSKGKNRKLIKSITFQTYPDMKKALIGGIEVESRERIQSMEKLLYLISANEAADQFASVPIQEQTNLNKTTDLYESEPVEKQISFLPIIIFIVIPLALSIYWYNNFVDSVGLTEISEIRQSISQNNNDSYFKDANLADAFKRNPSYNFATDILYVSLEHLKDWWLLGCSRDCRYFFKHCIYDMSGIENLKDLYRLDCSNNMLSSLSVRMFSDLTYLDCSKNNLSSLYLCSSIQDLICGDNPLYKLDLSRCQNLKALDCSGTNLSNLDLSNCPNLKTLYCYETNLSSLDLSKCPNLETLYCYETNLSSLDLSKCPNLETLRCNKTNLSSLNVSSCKSLEKLYCDGNKLSSLDVSNCPNLKYLSCDGNKLSSLDVSNCPKLKMLSCDGNNLSSLDVSNCPDLSDLFCSGNKLSSLDLSNCPKLFELKCEDNYLTKEDLIFSSGYQKFALWFNSKIGL